MSRLRVFFSVGILLLPFSLLLSTRALGQISATVSGQVTDQSGAVIPGAHMIAANVNTAAKTETTTNEEGSYAIPFLQPGVYNISTERSGFRPVIRSGVKLDVGQVARIDFVIQVGEVTQTVEVKSGAPLLETETSSIGQQIENKTVVTLPLNGRDYTQLVVLGAGAAPNHYSRAANGFSLNGSRTFQNTILLDGVDNTNRILGIDTGSIQAVRPSVDAIQEFKVETANYSAEYGRAAGGIVSVSIKSGTNEFHGALFEFLRNEKLDANDFFANRAGLTRPPLKRNELGGTLGGPIVRNHAFFFFSYEGTRQVSSHTGATTVPLPGMVQGNFGKVAIFDPLKVVKGARQEFPNNTIPPERIDPVGAKLAALYPPPNQPGSVNNFASNVRTTDNANEIDMRFDEQFRERDKGFVRYSRGIREINRGSVFSSPGNGGAGFGQFPLRELPRAYSVAGGETHILSSTVVNEFHAGYTHNESNQLAPEKQQLFDQFGIKGIPLLPGLVGLPQISVAGFSALGDRTFTPNPKLVQFSQANNTVSWVRGNHRVTLGGELLITHDFAGTSNAARGSFGFSGQFTSQIAGKGKGAALADLLLGQTSSAQLTTPLVGRFRTHYYGLFINDTWRFSRNLTLNLGLRYDLQTPLWERDNQMSNFVLDPRGPNFAKLIPASSGSYLSRTFSKLDKNTFAPRIGFAYQISPKTVLRSAFGIFYGGLGYQDIAHSGAANPPNFLSVSFPSATTASFSTIVLSNGFPPDTLRPQNVKNPNLLSISADFPVVTVYQWNLSAERQLSGKTVLSLAYVGSGTAKLLGNVDMNAPPPGPGAIQPRRPFPNYGAIILQTPFAHATYHSLQVRLQRHFTDGFSLLSAYTWSHSIDNVLSNEDSFGGNPQNPKDIAAEKSNSAFDIRQRFVTSVIYQLPLGRAGGVLGSSTVVRTLFGGWELGGILVTQTGFPYTPGVSPNPANTTTPERPDRLCDGNLSRGKRSVDRWFELSCFNVPAPFTFGNSGRGVLRGPGLVNLDALVDRTFHLAESKSLEFRAEFFNFTNSSHFGAPAANIAQPQTGRITSTSSPNREIQFGLRLTF